MDESSQRKLYALNLPTNSDKGILESIFGTETIESLCTEPVQNPNGVNAVEILFKDESAAAQARADFADDGFQIDDDGDNIRLLTFEEFDKYIPQQSSEPEPSHSEAIPVTPPSQVESEAVAVSPADSHTELVEDEVKPEAITDDEDETTKEENLPTKQSSLQNYGKWKPIPEWDSSDPANGQSSGWEPVDYEQNTTEWEASAPENGLSTWEPGVADQQSEVAQTVSSEITIEEVADRITNYVEEKRINWAEINENPELWALGDAISLEYNGLPDSLLKEALLMVLETQVTKNYNNWMRKHLQSLLRMWKMEAENENTQPRETKVVAEAVNYVPPPLRKKNTNAARRKLGQSLLSMGGFVEDLRAKFMTEEGELDIDEDANGQIFIDGQELSFDTWGEINKIQQDGAVRAEYIPPAPKKRRVIKPKPIVSEAAMAKPMNGEHHEKESRKERRKEELKAQEKKREKEREEGEMSDSEKSSASESSSSSSSESDSETRNRKKRRTQRIKGAGAPPPAPPNMKSIFDQFYQHRFAIIHSLSLQQKAAFLDVLRQTTTKMNPAQQQQMMMMMSSFMQSYQ